MPRFVSWLPCLAAIRRSVKNSVRSHYERKDLERRPYRHPVAANSWDSSGKTLTSSARRSMWFVQLVDCRYRPLQNRGIVQARPHE